MNKKKTTTKNTQIKRNNKSRDIKPLDLYEKIAVWVVIAFDYNIACLK